MPKFYGAARWAPKLILLQMLCMQVRCLSYTGLPSTDAYPFLLLTWCLSNAISARTTWLRA